MKLVRSRETFLREKRRGVKRTVGITVGSYDAFHRGHQYIFERLHERLSARATAETPPFAVLMTFVPHPRQVLRGISHRDLPQHPELLPVISFRERIAAADRFGFDAFFAVRFTSQFARMSPERFLEDYLFEPFDPKLIVIGDDWGFGRDRTGSVALLESEAHVRGTEVEVVAERRLHGARIRTSEVRNALQNGDLAGVAEALGRRFSMIGRVRHGDHRGRLIGFPTANVHLSPRVLPPFGVYAVWATIDGRRYPAVANLGVRPTFEGRALRFEIHLLEGGLDLYQTLLEVELVEFLRPEKRFGNVNELAATIAEDCRAAKSRLLP